MANYAGNQSSGSDLDAVADCLFSGVTYCLAEVYWRYQRLLAFPMPIALDVFSSIMLREIISKLITRIKRNFAARRILLFLAKCY